MGWFKKRRQEEVEDTKRLVTHAAQLHGVSAHEVVDTVLDQDDQDYLDYEDERKHGKAGVWVTLVVVGVVFGLGIVGLMKLAKMADGSGISMAQGQSQTLSSLAPSATPSALPTLTGQYIEFSYPQVFDSVRSMPNVPNSLERFMVGSKGDYRRLIAVEVESDTPTYKLDSGFAYRSLNPTLYTEAAATVGKSSAEIMVKTDGTERTLYWPHSDKMVIISVTDTNPNDNITQYLTTIANTLRWMAS